MENRLKILGSALRQSGAVKLFQQECWKPADVIAVVVILACTILISLGKDGTITAILLTVAAFYFGHQAQKATEAE